MHDATLLLVQSGSLIQIIPGYVSGLIWAVTPGQKYINKPPAGPYDVMLILL